MDAEGSNGFCPLVVVGEDGAAVAIASEGFGGEERSGGDVTEGAGTTVVESFAVGLGGAYGTAETLRTIFDEEHAFTFGNLADGVVVGRKTEEIDSDDGARAELHVVVDGADSVVEAAGIHVEGVGVDVNEDRCSTFECNDFGSCEECEVGHEDSVAFADAKGFECEGEGIGAIGTGEAMFYAYIFGQLLLKLADGFTHDEGGRIEDVADGVVDIGLKGLVLSFEVSELHVVEFLCIE